MQPRETFIESPPSPASARAWMEATARCVPPVKAYLARLDHADWPAVQEYNALLRAQALTRAGHAIRFVAPQGLADTLGYEQRVYETGVVATRERNWHDLFNALIWSTFPRAKAAINARHYEELRGAAPGANKRTRARDALTLLDESGVVVASDAPDLLALIRDMRWRELFWRRRSDVIERMRFIVFGHGLCEQALRPYVGLTGKALLLTVAPSALSADESQLAQTLDAQIARWCEQPALTPNDLHPLPILGVPGWWPDNERAQFYDNAAYFRSRRGRLTSSAA